MEAAERIAELEREISDLERGRQTTREYIIELEYRIAKLKKELAKEVAERDDERLLYEDAVAAALVAGANAECERIENSSTYRVGRAVLAPMRAVKTAKRLVTSRE